MNRDNYIEIFSAAFNKLFELSSYHSPNWFWAFLIIPVILTYYILKNNNDQVDVQFSSSEGFQEDLYPDSFLGEPSHTCDEWMNGSSKTPILGSLDPDEIEKSGPKVVKKFVAAKTPMQLTKELEVANERIKLLEKRLADAGLSTN